MTGWLCCYALLSGNAVRCPDVIRVNRRKSTCSSTARLSTSLARCRQQSTLVVVLRHRLRLSARHVKPKSSPSGTAGERRLPLASTAAREVHLTRRRRPCNRAKGRPSSPQTVVGCVTAWPPHQGIYSQGIYNSHTLESTIHAGINSLQLTLENFFNSRWKTCSSPSTNHISSKII